MTHPCKELSKNALTSSTFLQLGALKALTTCLLVRGVLGIPRGRPDVAHLQQQSLPSGTEKLLP